MASEELIKFDKEFPNSKYREIHAQYTGPMDSDADKEKYQKKSNKCPFFKCFTSTIDFFRAIMLIIVLLFIFL